MSNNFGIECVAKNKKPQCDQQIILEGDQAPIALVQGVWFAAGGGDGAPLNSGLVIEIGTLENHTITLMNPSIGVSLSPVINIAPATPRRIQVPLGGNYHYDIMISYDLSSAGGAGDTIQIGPTVDGIALQALSHSSTDVYGDLNDTRSRILSVSGNLNLNAGQAVGIYRLCTSITATTFLLVECRLRIFRTGPII